MIQYFRTPPNRRRHTHAMWILGAAALLLFLLFFAALGGIRSMRDSIPGTDAAERWRAQDSPYPYAQLAVYTDSSAAFDLDSVQLRRMDITKKLEENAFSSPEGASPFIDAYSGETTISLRTDRAMITADATVCGGNFFFFHPLELSHGGYFDEDDLTSHSVIIDEYAAWQLFGAIEVAGMDISIGGQPFRISGVCKKPTGTLEAMTWGDTPRIFINYIGLRMTNGFDRATSYEIVMPNPIDNFANTVIAQQFSIGERSTNAVLYDFTTRFSFEVLAKQAPSFFLRAIRENRVLPPFWENNAAVTETKAIVLAFFGAIAGITALVCAVSAVSLWFFIHPIRMTDIYHWFNDKYEARRMKKWLKKQASPLNAPEKTRT